MHHVPVVGTRFANNHKIRVHIGNSETGFVQFMNQCAFAHHIRFLAFLATQEIGSRHRRGIKHAVRYIDTCGGKAVRQILPSLRRIVGQQHQRQAFIHNPVQKFRCTRYGDVIVHQHAVDIANYIFNGHGLPRILTTISATIKAH